MIMNHEQVRILKEAVKTYFKILPQYSPKEMEENHRNLSKDSR